MIDSQLSVRDLLHRGLDSFLGDLSPVTDTPVAKVGVPAPVPEPEFPMSSPEFLPHFLSPLDLQIVRAIGRSNISSKELAARMDMRSDDGSPLPDLKYALRFLKARNLVVTDGKTYSLSAYIISVSDTIPGILDA